ncbi:hypothetical protein PTKIN_Ptkin16aG0028100 [Pterospermum kingtungense]
MLLGDEGGKLGTKLSTIEPYTTMESSIYAIFTKAYVKAVTSMNITRVAAMAPFGLCFSSKGVRNSILGPLVPGIDLILDGGVEDSGKEFHGESKQSQRGYVLRAGGWRLGTK